MTDRLLRPNYRRARALAMEIEALRQRIADEIDGPEYNTEAVDDLKAELAHLEHEMFLTGVTSEYDL